MDAQNTGGRAGDERRGDCEDSEDSTVQPDGTARPRP